MRKKNVIRTKKCLVSILATGLSVGMLVGCGQSSASEVNQEEASITITEDADAVETFGKESSEDDYVNAIEERAGKTSFESYDEIIGLLESGEGYAYVNVKGYDGDVLAVATAIHDDQSGHMVSTECTFYTIKGDGTVNADALLTSGGTANPIAIDGDSVIYAASHKTVHKYCYATDIPDGVGMMCLAQVRGEDIQDDGNPTSIFGDYRTDNTISNDDNCVEVEESDIDFYNQMFDEYFNSEPISFTVAFEELGDVIEDTDVAIFDNDVFSFRYDPEYFTVMESEECVTVSFYNETMQTAGSNTITFTYVENADAMQVAKEYMEEYGASESEIFENYLGGDDVKGYGYTTGVIGADDSELKTSDTYHTVPCGNDVIVINTFNTYGTDMELDNSIDAMFGDLLLSFQLD